MIGDLDWQAAFQDRMLALAQERVNLPRMLATPTVVVPLAFDEVYPTIATANQLVREQAERAIRDGSLIPVNGELLTDITQIHSLFHSLLHDVGKIPVIPTYVNLSRDGQEDRDSVFYLRHSRYQVPTIPFTYVSKRSFTQQGVLTSHGGKGISIFRESPHGLHSLLPRYLGEFTQEFVLPWTDEQGQTYVRDIRVFLVGGRAVAALERRARNPLSEENLVGRVAPDISQVYSARDRGPRKALEGNLKAKAFKRGELVVSVLKKILETSSRPFSKFSPVGYMSVDFLLDANRELLPVDCDILPMVDSIDDNHVKVAEALAKYLKELSNAGGKNRQVIIIGDLRDRFIYQACLKAKSLLGERMIFQQTILNQ